MNYAQLQAAVLEDTHKAQYVGAPIQRFIEQAEALIFSKLEAYNLISTLTDVDRIAPDSPIYLLPAKLTNLRYVKINGLPLEKLDETGVFLYSTANSPIGYVQRVGQIEIVGNPGPGTVVTIDYMGMPAALAVAPTNTLLDDYPQLYQDAASIFVFRRAQDYESASIASTSVMSCINEINRKVKKLLGGASAAPAYNTSFRSSY